MCGGDTLPAPGLPADVQQTVELIDVLWFEKNTGKPVCAFEVEQSTSIYSGILRMKDLAMSVPDQQCHFYLVAPESREKEVVAQMLRPGLRGGEDVFRLGYLPSGELKQQCDALCRYGVDRSVLFKLAKAHTLCIADCSRRGDVIRSMLRRRNPAGASASTSPRPFPSGLAWNPS